MYLAIPFSLFFLHLSKIFEHYKHILVFWLSRLFHVPLFLNLDDASMPTTVVTEPKKCTKDVDNKVSGHILSPGYPYEYPNNLNYTRIILIGNKTSVNFSILDLESETRGESDCYDYLKVSSFLRV